MCTLPKMILMSYFPKEISMTHSVRPLSLLVMNSRIFQIKHWNWISKFLDKFRILCSESSPISSQKKSRDKQQSRKELLWLLKVKNWNQIQNKRFHILHHRKVGISPLKPIKTPELVLPESMIVQPVKREQTVHPIWNQIIGLLVFRGKNEIFIYTFSSSFKLSESNNKLDEFIIGRTKAKLVNQKNGTAEWENGVKQQLNRSISGIAE